jgi:hypothetical protein
LGSLGGTAVLGGLTWIVVAAVRLYEDAKDSTEKAAALQAVAAGVGLTATVLLLVVTAWYAVLTRDISRRSGPIVSAELKIGWLDPGHQGVLTAPFDLTTRSFDERFTIPMLVVHVTNSGNGAVTVDSVGVRHSTKVEFSMTSHHVGTQVPHRLEGNTSVSFYLPIDEFVAAAKVFGKDKPGKAQAKAYLGNGDVVESSWQRAQLP